jgi:GDP-D-mannose dehydratase
LGWKIKVGFKQLIEMMVDADMARWRAKLPQEKSIF